MYRTPTHVQHANEFCISFVPTNLVGKKSSSFSFKEFSGNARVRNETASPGLFFFFFFFITEHVGITFGQSRDLSLRLHSLTPLLAGLTKKRKKPSAGEETLADYNFFFRGFQDDETTVFGCLDV